jgi:hypothetical protein
MYAYGRASKKESYINRFHLCHYHLISSWRLGISVRERGGWKVDVLLLEPLEVAKGFTSMMGRAERPPGDQIPDPPGRQPSDRDRLDRLIVPRVHLPPASASWKQIELGM